MDAGKLLGEYLRARRELVRPQDVGMPDAGRRRVPGLRREELAALAGISMDYYLRLEQGRDRSPSPQVLDALAEALQLDDDATAHLHLLARPTSRHRRRRPERVPACIQRLVASWTDIPAFVLGIRGDVLFANSLATALSPFYAQGVNLLREMLVDPRARDMFEDWEDITAGMIAGLRGLAGPDVDDPRLTEVVGELSMRSERFRVLWARHDVKCRSSGLRRRIRHPLVGLLDLWYEKLTIAETDGQMLLIYHPDPGSASARRLGRLARIAAAHGDGPA